MSAVARRRLGEDARTRAVDHVALGRRLGELRSASGLPEVVIAKALVISRSAYSHIESGERLLTGDELVTLADIFGVRAAAITGLATIEERARSTADVECSDSATGTMSSRLHAYLELDAYLTSQGIP